MELTIQSALPDPSISQFVHSFWMVENKTGKDISSTVLPNGMMDMMLMNVNSMNWKMVVRGIDTMPSQVTIPADAQLFSIGFKLLAVEYLLGNSIKGVLNGAQPVSDEFWQFETVDLNSLENFCNKATQKIKILSPENVDSRKKKLFALIYSSRGSMTVRELSDNVYWSSRQINRYFNQQFGISLKAYCNILRFGASFKNISEGNLFPEQNFTDQTHFIKEIKKYAGVTPKVLSKNEDERFIDLVSIKKLPS
ncbi:helix-turn-helix domain-containing protein [Larkinella humicola]|uniref:Helix-turn-helix transcriptional regulator n=1 Tax=Larkinella humicola TaxID=2607654 RepID=A0A5N1JGA9_9BACT|nr:AraC family transcriptional regulator [Larkinella humicola]KAA9352778.1 helix-turn-helix transcriptional regulator [Larkinella humicola]